MKILVNHVGYDLMHEKYALIDSGINLEGHTAAVIEKDSGERVFSGRITYGGRIPGWSIGNYYIFDFTEFIKEGRYYVTISHDDTVRISEIFAIGKNIFVEETLSDILYYFKTVRCTDQYDRQDHAVPVYGNRDKLLDVHGGWYDASGDYSKYLSHLSYTNFMNPQQTPLAVWLLIDSYENLKDTGNYDVEYRERFLNEALHGADFLVRMQDASGFFYMIVFDKWSKDIDERELCSYTTQQGIKNGNYHAGFRQGGGLAIAALARISACALSGDYPPSVYLNAAVKGFEHLGEHNTEYLNDSRENIIDDYCALLASVELYRATGETDYAEYAKTRSENLAARISSDNNFEGWFRADDTGEIPFFHASDAGLPVIALLRYLEAVDSSDIRIKSAVKNYLQFELSVTSEVNNPFGYSRQYVKPLNEPAKSSFFFPHSNWSGYWWQGENSRIASLASAVFRAAPYIDDEVFKKRLISHGLRQINWILGINPFDICMLNGKGANNVNYERTWQNADGGIINGITGGFYNEADIAFMPEKLKDDPDHSWRWCEQWLIHSAWYMSAICQRGINK